ncbi:MAG: hypothetical protein AAB403_08205 [Planctomycetota bacterium]
MTEDHYAGAGALIELHGASHGLSTLDSLQLAVALGLRRVGAIENLVATDKVLCKVTSVDETPVTNASATTL